MVGGVDVLPYVESDLKRIAARVIEKAKELCTANSVVLAAKILSIYLLIFNFYWGFSLICSLWILDINFFPKFIVGGYVFAKIE